MYVSNCLASLLIHFSPHSLALALFIKLSQLFESLKFPVYHCTDFIHVYLSLSLLCCSIFSYFSSFMQEVRAKKVLCGNVVIWQELRFFNDTNKHLKLSSKYVHTSAATKQRKSEHEVPSESTGEHNCNYFVFVFGKRLKQFRVQVLNVLVYCINVYVSSYVEFALFNVSKLTFFTAPRRFLRVANRGYIILVCGLAILVFHTS